MWSIIAPGTRPPAPTTLGSRRLTFFLSPLGNPPDSLFPSLVQVLHVLQVAFCPKFFLLLAAACGRSQVLTDQPLQPPSSLRPRCIPPQASYAITHLNA